MNYLDIVVMVLYITGITTIGIAYSGRQSVQDYFLGNRNIPWLMVCFSIVATETSTLTFLSIPGLAYVKGFSFMQMTFGYLLGRILIAFILLPKMMNGKYETAYHYLQSHYGGRIRKLMSVLFLVTRLLADGVRLFATAIPLSILTGLSVPLSIAIIALVTFFYTWYGGVKSVIIVDSIQLVIYLSCAFIGIYVIGDALNLSLADMFRSIPSDKINIISSGFENGISGFFGGYSLPVGILGGAVFSFASHGIDHMIVQRLLCCRDLKAGQKAIIGSGILIVFQFALFLFLGVMLFLFFGGRIFEHSDSIMPEFIIKHLAPGVRGLMLAGIFAAAMSSLSSSINSLSASTVIDILAFDEKSDPRKQLLVSRMISLVWTGVLILFALMLSSTRTPLVELGLGIAGFTYGAMLGIFVLAILSVKLNQSSVIAGIVSGIAVVLVLRYSLNLFWIWFVPVSSVTTVVLALCVNRLMPRKV